VLCPGKVVGYRVIGRVSLQLLGHALGDVSDLLRVGAERGAVAGGLGWNVGAFGEGLAVLVAGAARRGFIVLVWAGGFLWFLIVVVVSGILRPEAGLSAVLHGFGSVTSLVATASGG